MPDLQGGARGVTVRDDLGRMLGIAHSGGGSLSSADALAQLGYELADNEAGCRPIQARQSAFEISRNGLPPTGGGSPAGGV
jgi:hypothetical protein